MHIAHNTTATAFIQYPRQYKKYMTTIYDVLLSLDMKISLKAIHPFIKEIKIIWKVVENGRNFQL